MEAITEQRHEHLTEEEKKISAQNGYWKPHVSNFSALSIPTISKAVAAQKIIIRDIE